MKRMFLGLLVAAAFSGGCVEADQGCCGSFEVSGEWLYLEASSCDRDFVIQDVRPFDPDTIVVAEAREPLPWLPQGRSHGIEADYESGFRIGLGYVAQGGCYDARVEYTYYHPTQTVTLRQPNVGVGFWPVAVQPRYTGTLDLTNEDFLSYTPIFTGLIAETGDFIEVLVNSRLKYDYDAVELQFASRSREGCRFSMRTYAGLHFWNLDVHQSNDYRGVFIAGEGGDVQAGLYEVSTHENKNTWGIGPLFGWDGRYEIACCFGIGAHVGAALLAGQTDGRLHEDHFSEDFVPTPPVTVDEISDICRDHRNHLVPYLRGRLGINYLWCCGSCFKVLAEVGYEFSSYINAVGQFRINDQRATAMTNCSSYNMDGIYVSVRATL